MLVCGCTCLLGALLPPLITLCCCVALLLLLLLLLLMWLQVGRCATSDQLNLRHVEAPAAAAASHRVVQHALNARHADELKLALEPAVLAVQLARVANQLLLCRVGDPAGVRLVHAAFCCLFCCKANCSISRDLVSPCLA
jgi:hypothetical protein